MKKKDGPGQVLKIPWTKIRPYKGQPREYFDRERLEKLAKSIKKVGQKTPVKVRKLAKPEDGFEYELIDGQRRWHAVQIAGLKTLEAIVVEVSDEKQQFIDSLISNCHSEEHTPMEYAHSIDKLRKWGLDLGGISEIFGKSTTWVVQYFNLLKLETEVTDLMDPSIPEDRRLGFTTALLLVNIPADVQKALAKEISSKKLSLAKARHLIKKTVHAKGIIQGVRRQRPGRRFGQLFGSIERANSEIELLLDTPVPQFKETLRGGNEKQQAKLLELIISSTEQYVALRQFVERTIAANKATPVPTSPKK